MSATTTAPDDSTTIRVPVGLRNKIKTGAGQYSETQSAYIERAIRELKQREFLDRVAAHEPDAEDIAELREWEQADIGPVVPE